MKDKTAGNQRIRLAAAVAVLAAVGALTAGCGVVHVRFGSSGAAGSATFRPTIAFSQCMRRHGLPNFPGPNSASSVTMRVTGHSPVVRAYDACKDLLPR